MSPEQCEAGTIDARSDIYSLGCTIFEVLTGAPPFRGRNVVDTMLKHQSAVPPTLQGATGGKSFPPLLEQVVAKMLAKSPAARYQTMEEAAEDLQAIIDGRTPPAPSQAPAPTPQAVPFIDETLISPATSQSVRRPVQPRPEPGRHTGQADTEEEDSTPFETSMPPNFILLMVGVFCVMTVTLAALGYWWVQQKNSSRPTSPASAAPVDLYRLTPEQTLNMAIRA